MGKSSKSLRRVRSSAIHIELMEARTLLSGYTANLVAPIPTRTNTDFNPASSSMVRDASTGMLYGFDTAGGTNGTGTIYQVDPTTKALTVLDALGADGPEDPIQLLSDSSGDIFGLSQVSGTASNPGETGGPELFELPAGNLGTPIVDYTFAAAAFSGGTIGTEPLAMVIDSSNNIFVLNSFGGTNNGGTVDEFSPGSSYETPSVLGSLPEDYHSAPSELTLGQNGAIFGTTAYGGTNAVGSLWELTPGETVATNVASFSSTTGSPTANENMYVDVNNDVFGTTNSGIWEFVSGTQALSIIASFSSTSGFNPSGGVIADSSGNLFGTTAQGDTNGTFFEMNASTHAITYSDVGSTATGTEPFSTPVADGKGDFYIVTTDGAANNAGAVIEMTPGSSGGGGGGGGGTTGTVALSTSITRSTVASTVIGETKLRGASVTINVTNDGSAIIKGLDKVELFASQDGVIDSSSIQVGTIAKAPAPRPGKSVPSHITIPSLNLSAGGYTLLSEVIDASGDIATAATGTSVTVNAPFVAVTGVIGAVTPDIVKSVGTFKLTLENSGNIEATGKAMIIVGLSADGVTVSEALPSTIIRPVNIFPGRPTTLVLHIKLPKGFAAGTYYPFVSYTQGTTSFAMAGTAAFTVK